MAAITNTSKNALGQISPVSILLATSGDTLTFTSGNEQILLLFNSDTSTRTVTIDGSSGTTVTLPNTGGATASVASGVTYSILAGAYAVVRLDTIPAYCAGTVSIVASVGAKVAACIIY